MSVSVSMPQLGESVTEGTVTRWLKHEGEHVDADEPLLEVSTDKVDTEIPSPVSGILRGITVAEDETVAVGAELAIIDEEGAGGGPASAQDGAASTQADGAEAPAQAEQEGTGASGAATADGGHGADAQPQAEPASGRQQAGDPEPDTQQQEQPAQRQPEQEDQQPEQQEDQQPEQQDGQQPRQQGYQQPGYQRPGQPSYQQPTYQQPPGQPSYQQPPPGSGQDAYPQAGQEPSASPGPAPEGAESPYVTPLVRKLASEHGVDLASLPGTGVGGRIRKQDVLDAARSQGDQGPAEPPQAGPPAASQAQQAAPPQPAVPAQSGPGSAAAQPTAAEDEMPRARRPAIVPSSLRGTTERMSRARQVIAQRMVESLQVSAQLTTVVEADVTALARLRDRAKSAFEAREGVKLSFLPFFAQAAVEALKVHPKVNAVIDTASGQVTYHDAEHLGIAVDTERGLMVPVIRNAGDLNIAGLARKIADLAERTRAGHVNPDDLSGGTFTLTNTGSRGALFDTPIINQPQVAILGTGTVVKRPVVVEDPKLGEVIAVRSMVYLALTYDHRLVDGADAARFLMTVKNRLEEGAFETELGL
jgi:pyruvate dehydrogenase E2 component (dihydrolipoamide acetyltransferase)